MQKRFWTPEEDQKLIKYMETHDKPGQWRDIPKLAGLKRPGKSCRLRWTSYLDPGIKRGNFSEEEVATILKLQSEYGNKWKFIARQLPGRTNTEIKNFWNTMTRKKLGKKDIPPATQTPSQLLIAGADLLASTADYLRNCALRLYSDAQLRNIHLPQNPEVRQGSAYVTPDPAAQLHGVSFISTDLFGAPPGQGPSIPNTDSAPDPQANNNYTDGLGSLFGNVPNACSTPALMVSELSDRSMTNQVENNTNTSEAWLQQFLSAEPSETSDTFCGHLALE